MSHAEWLSLVEISGPFLTVPVLENAFPQGLEAVETPRRQRLRAAYDEWREAVDQKDEMLDELHREWIRLVLNELLEYGEESLVEADKWSGELPSVSSQDRAGVFKPDWIVLSSAQEKPRLFVAVLPPDTDFDSIQRDDDWPLSPRERMTLLCRNHGVRLGIMTDGERWMLVNAPIGSSSSQTSWYARLWFQEPITLKAFQSLLGVRRCFGPTEDTLESLLDESLEHQEEVTDTLGEQVRRAVEVLVQCLDKADSDRNRELLLDVEPEELYEAGLTVMMRLVFILCAEERGLLLLGDPTYDSFYAVSTLRGHLEETAELHGPEVLERRHDAWARLLALFRAVYGGIEHENLRMPALGGSLFDPDRFPFLEGRAKGTNWRNTAAVPLPIDNRTVMLLLKSLQILEQLNGGLLLSYRALDVEQIGHVYEGLLEHTVARVPCVTLGLQGSRNAKNPNVALADLESARLAGDSALIKLLVEVSKRSETALRRALSNPTDDSVFSRVVGICGGDRELAARIKPFTNLLRTDAWNDPIVYRENSFMITLGADRRETGTHYTPKNFTESIVTTTLEPVVYIGPAEAKPREEWKLKSSREILDLNICDPAMGSGAFLVQVCRYLAEKLVDAWHNEESTGKVITFDGEVLDELGKKEPMPSQLDERLTIARRLVAERCLYGVDVNPMAVELAKLSIWLVTLAKGRPFGFLDHNLRCGDSLLGIHRLEQLTMLSMDAKSGQQYQLRMFANKIKDAVEEAIELRKRLRNTTIRDIKDVEAMAELDRATRHKLGSVELIADTMIGEALRCGSSSRNLEIALNSLAMMADDFLCGNENMDEQIASIARNDLAIDLPPGKCRRKPFHWALEFPEVFSHTKKRFDAIVGNPPFLGGSRITGSLGTSYRNYLVHFVAKKIGNADLVAYFFLRASQLISEGSTLGLLSTKTISQGDTREVCLDQLLEELTVYSASDKVAWPGRATVVVSILNMSKGKWMADKYLNGKRVDHISSFLSDEHDGVPQKLESNKGCSYTGNKPTGMGFIVEENFAADLLARESKYESVLFKYLNGNDLNGTPTQEPSRWCINFWDWPIEEAMRFPDLFDRLERLVKPVRQGLNSRSLVNFWWIHERNRSAMYHAIGRGQRFHRRPRGDWPDHALSRVLVISQVTKHLTFSFVRNDFLIDQACIVFPYTQYYYFALLSSNIHEAWVRKYSSTLGSSTLCYTPSDVFETFPFPRDINPKERYDEPIIGTLTSLETVGKELHDLRLEIMASESIGLTDLYNSFHSPEYESREISKMRSLQIKIDNMIANLYGWTDINLDHSYYELDSLPASDRIRFTICNQARTETIRRLLKLNYKQ